MRRQPLTLTASDNGYVIEYLAAGRLVRLVTKTRRKALEIAWEWMTGKDAGFEDVRVRIVRRKP